MHIRKIYPKERTIVIAEELAETVAWLNNYHVLAYHEILTYLDYLMLPDEPVGEDFKTEVYRRYIDKISGTAEKLARNIDPQTL